jgi:hypothetical protein
VRGRAENLSGGRETLVCGGDGGKPCCLYSNPLRLERKKRSEEGKREWERRERGEVVI